MKKTRTRRLQLNKTTLLQLEGSALQEVAGEGITLLCTISLYRSVIGCPIEIESMADGCVVYA